MSKKRNFIAEWLYRSTLGAKLDALVVTILLPTLLLTLTLYFTAEQLQQNFLTTGNYRQFIFDLSALRSNLLNVETGLRGYALAQETQFLEPYNRGLEESVKMQKILEDSTLFEQPVVQLGREVRDYLEWTKLQLRQQTNSAALKKTIVEDGKVRFDRLRVLLDQLSATALGKFQAMRQVTLGNITQVRWLPWILFIFLLVAALMVRAGLFTYVLRPLQQIEKSTEARLAGEVAPLLSSPDEIGQVALRLNAAYDALEARNQDLKRSNTDLEQFAYVASHDLQEPLRMISSYTQLLAKRYRGQLDERADQYIHFAVDGATRMQALIEDLLQFSRVGTRPIALIPTDAGVVLQNALRTHELAIQAAKAEVIVAPMPTVFADSGQLEQVLSNLIGNAIKFRRAGVPHQIKISAQRESEELWRFTVSDNGIGIEPEYFERIFTIFQRLNTRESYSGSGIGLAIVKRIIERHGGTVWLESTPNFGTEFHFTLQAAQGNHA